jgi:UDP-N-acetyl-2-amino-2-deoxyglucuronate dehydrogenase
MSGHRAGSIGLGSAVTKHALALRELSDRIQIVGGWSPSKQRRDAFAATYDLPAADTLEAILDDRSVNLVFVLTPPWTHLDLVKRCAAAGKHILPEKPIEATLERSEQAVQLCETAGIKLGVVFQNRFRKPYLKARDLA